MVKGSDIDWVRLWTAMAVVVLLTLFWWGAFSLVVTGADAKRDVEMMLMPGSSKSLPMPPEWMRKEIEAKMERGEVPGFLTMSASKLRKACGNSGHVLGCAVSMAGLKVIYVRSGMDSMLHHMVVVHEYAHDLYDWEH